MAGSFESSTDSVPPSGAATLVSQIFYGPWGMTVASSDWTTTLVPDTMRGRKDATFCPAPLWIERMLWEGGDMTTVLSTLGPVEEIADFLASCPAPDELLRFRPSPEMRARAEELLEKLKDGCLSTEERKELELFEQAERLMRLVKARVQAREARRS